MELSKDNLIQELSESIFEPVEKPYLSKEMLIVEDNNGSSDYSRNIVKFETTALGNNGLYVGYKEGYISIPMVGVLSSDVEITAADAKSAFLFKSSNLNLLDHVTCKYGNSEVVQGNANINSYLIYKQHVKQSQDDVNINGATTGYRKDDSESWSFSADAGMMNNILPTFTGLPIEVKNKTLKSRISDNTEYGRDAVLSNDSLLESGADTHVKYDAGLTWVYYFDCIILLKDLLFFNEMPLVRGAVLSITFQMNQATTTTEYKSKVIFDVNNVLTKNTNPMMRGRSVDLLDCVETMSLKVGSNKIGATTFAHEKGRCRLYLPAYQLAPTIETRYLSLGQKQIHYEDVIVQRFQDVKGSISHVITQSLAGATQLVICPTLARGENGTLGQIPCESVFACEPSVCSPYLIKNFNCVIGGRNLYSSPVDYKYEHFMNESNGAESFDANLTVGNTSGQISMKDYMETYGYIVVDLSRKYSYDAKTATSYKITGNITSGKDLDLLCFISYSKTLTIDLNTGGIVSQD